MEKDNLFSSFDSKYEELKQALKGNELKTIKKPTLVVHAMVHPAEISGKREKTIDDMVFALYDLTAGAYLVTVRVIGILTELGKTMLNPGLGQKAVVQVIFIRCFVVIVAGNNQPRPVGERVVLIQVCVPVNLTFGGKPSQLVVFVTGYQLVVFLGKLVSADVICIVELGNNVPVLAVFKPGSESRKVVPVCGFNTRVRIPLQCRVSAHVIDIFGDNLAGSPAAPNLSKPVQLVIIVP